MSPWAQGELSSANHTTLLQYLVPFLWENYTSPPYWHQVWPCDLIWPMKCEMKSYMSLLGRSLKSWYTLGSVFPFSTGRQLVMCQIEAGIPEWLWLWPVHSTNCPQQTNKTHEKETCVRLNSATEILGSFFLKHNLNSTSDTGVNFIWFPDNYPVSNTQFFDYFVCPHSPFKLRSLFGLSLSIFFVFHWSCVVMQQYSTVLIYLSL